LSNLASNRQPPSAASKPDSASSSRPTTSGLGLATTRPSTSSGDQAANRQKMFNEKKEAKRSILAWLKQFEATNGREATKQERDKEVGHLYKEYRIVGFLTFIYLTDSVSTDLLVCLFASQKTQLLKSFDALNPDMADKADDDM
jgi:hypothetical protein